MTEPESLIADLDEALADAGEDIVLQHLTLGPGGSQIPFSVTCRAAVRGYSPDEIAAGTLTQKDRKIILSPTEITLADWPGAMPVGADIDKRIPGYGDRVKRSGQTMTVHAAEGIYVQGDLVRLEMQCRGD